AFDAEVLLGCLERGIAGPAGCVQILAEIVDRCLLGREVPGSLALREGFDDPGVELGFARQLLVHEPFVLAGPAPRADQHRQLDELRRQGRLPAQLLAERLQAARELGVVDPGDERAAHLAARPGGDLRRDLALHGRHLLRGKLREALCHASMMADVLLVVHFLIAAFIVLGLAAVWLGAALGWRWVRNPWFRYLHLSAIAFVAAEAVLGVMCPLTVWEDMLRGG